MVKTTNAGVTALLNAVPPVYFAIDFYTLTTNNGPVVRLCTGDFDGIDLSANVYSSGSINSGSPKIDLKQSKVQGHAKRGLDSDTWIVALAPTTQDPWSGAFTYPDVVGGTPWLTACRAGLFDGASVLVQRAYYPSPPNAPYSVAERTCVGTVTVFSGIVGTVDCHQTQCVFTFNDYKYALGMSMPRNLVQASCRHLLYDTRCTLVASSYAQTAVALVGSTPSLVLATPTTPGGSATYTLGTMTCTSGANDGFSRTIVNWDTISAFQPIVPWPFAVAPGDGFTFYPGCDKTMATCNLFGNIANFLGESFAPVPEIQIG